MWLDAFSDLAQIITALVALLAYGRYRWLTIEKRRRLEEYLRLGRPDGHICPNEKGKRTITHLSGQLRMTEADVLQAGFSSKKIISSLGTDPATGRANAIFFQLKSDDPHLNPDDPD